MNRHDWRKEKLSTQTDRIWRHLFLMQSLWSERMGRHDQRKWKEKLSMWSACQPSRWCYGTRDTPSWPNLLQILNQSLPFPNCTEIAERHILMLINSKMFSWALTQYKQMENVYPPLANIIFKSLDWKETSAVPGILLEKGSSRSA